MLPLATVIGQPCAWVREIRYSRLEDEHAQTVDARCTRRWSEEVADSEDAYYATLGMHKPTLPPAFGLISYDNTHDCVASVPVYSVPIPHGSGLYEASAAPWRTSA